MKAQRRNKGTDLREEGEQSQIDSKLRRKRVKKTDGILYRV
jgi:hypothetical protein